ncbi:BTAD domain-containing putative transcriptional regulator [Nocardioides flavescens]|uniref:Transcriptional regulator n=1 Tax=Nocardioides flavescens TaxID=2691959 RepID=A0A6L7F3J6_9ACTN|nr:transcriptional regulator [Nocardioides flavescens]
MQLRLLGGFAATQRGDEVRLSVAAQRVLALLAVAERGRTVPRTTVAERLWPDSRGDRAASNLRTVLWRMQRPSGRALAIGTSHDVHLAPEVEVDLWRAHALVEQLGSREGLPDPLDAACLHEDLLPRWDEDWLVVEREDHRQRRLHALEALSLRLQEQGRYAEALTVALGAVGGEPLRETAHRRVIEVHLLEGNRSEAVRHYHRYCRLLAAELGLGPSASLDALVGPLLRRPAHRERALARPVARRW